MTRWLAALLLALLSPAGAQRALPVLQTVGVHRVAPAAGEARWLGPGGDPAWAPGGDGLVVVSQRAPLGAPPLGTLVALGLAPGEARATGEAADRLAPKVSPSGRYLAVIQGQPGPAVVIVDRTTGAALAPPTAIAALSDRSPDAFAWAPGADLLWIAGADGGLRSQEVGAAAVAVSAPAGVEGVWPAPDGGSLAVRVGEGIQRLDLAAIPSAPTMLVPASPGASLDTCFWTPDSAGVWVVAVEDRTSWVKRYDGVGELPAAGWPLAGEAVSRVGFRDGAAAYVAVVAGQASLNRLELETGTVAPLAQIAGGVPLPPAPGWRVAAPVARPGTDEWAVSLGRSDRWGIRDADKSSGTDTDVTGKTVKVVRRGRTVGSSGVVFDAGDSRFLGRVAPTPASGVVDGVRPGTMRWSRPSPARWVVLHHTATRSDGGSLNALTSPSAGRLAQLYADITPGAWMPAEPRTIGVHYLVLRAGTVLQLAEENTITRHAGTGQWANTGPVFDFNAETIGIEIVAMGNDFTAGQVRNVGRLVADICRRQGIPLTHINGQRFTEGVLYHRDFAGGLRGKPDPAGWPWETMRQHAERYLSGQ